MQRSRRWHISALIRWSLTSAPFTARSELAAGPRPSCGVWSTASLLTITASNTGEAVPERRLWLSTARRPHRWSSNLAVALVIPIAAACEPVRDGALQDAWIRMSTRFT